jgi:hypothetical protein
MNEVSYKRRRWPRASSSVHGGRSPPYISPSCFEGSVGWAVPTDFMKMALRSMKFHTSAAAGLKSGQSNRKRITRMSNIEPPTSNNEFCQLKKRLSKTTLPDWLRRPRANLPFDIRLTTEGFVAGCDLLVLKSIKRSAINIRRSMLDVRVSRRHTALSLNIQTVRFK